MTERCGSWIPGSQASPAPRNDVRRLSGRAGIALAVHHPQLGLESLAVVVLRQRLDEHIILGPLEARDRIETERVQLGAGRIADHISHYHLAPFAVRPADH